MTRNELGKIALTAALVAVGVPLADIFITPVIAPILRPTSVNPKPTVLENTKLISRKLSLREHGMLDHNQRLQEISKMKSGEEVELEIDNTDWYVGEPVSVKGPDGKNYAFIYLQKDVQPYKDHGGIEILLTDEQKLQYQRTHWGLPSLKGKGSLYSIPNKSSWKLRAVDFENARTLSFVTISRP